MKTKIDVNNWNRKEYFEFFTKFDDPNTGIVANIDCTVAYANAKALNESFYTYYLYKILKAVNSTEAFKYRIENGEVYRYDTIHCSSTVGRDDNSFGYSFFLYDEDRKIFKSNVESETERIKRSTGLMLSEETARPDVIHFSALPWVSFTSLKHATNFSGHNGVPKISPGKIFRSEGRLLMPVQIEVHHGLADGFHIAQLIDNIRNLFDEKISII